MDYNDIIAEIDAEIVRLQNARAALTGSTNGTVRRGGAKFSAATRKRMSEAMKARWAKAKKAGKQSLK